MSRHIWQWRYFWSLQVKIERSGQDLIYHQYVRTLFLFGCRRLLRPKKSQLLNNDTSPVVLGSNEACLKNLQNEILKKKIWNSEFIQYQNTLQLEVLKEVLDVPDIKANSIVEQFPVFNFTDSECIRDSFHYLISKGLYIDSIQKMPWLLAMKTTTMEERYAKLKKYLNIEKFSSAAPLLEIPESRLLYLSRVWKKEEPLIVKEIANHELPFPNRLYFLASKLTCDPAVVSDMMRKMPYIMSGSFSSSILPKLRLLLDSDVDEADVAKDPWIFSQNLASLEERIELCRSYGLEVIKPWMLRARRKSFQEYVERLIQEEELLRSHNGIQEFLAERLNCDDDAVVRLLERVPAIKSASASKLNKMIQFLYSCGFTSHHILEAPAVLAHSPETVEGRLSELRSFGCYSYNSVYSGLLRVICLSKKRYRTFVKSLKEYRNVINLR